MSNLLNVALPAAGTYTSGAFQLAEEDPDSIAAQANLTYGSGGTTLDCYVQTTLDQGATWEDIMNFHFTTASARLLQNVSRLTAVLASATAKDGALAANTATDGLIGNQFRVKYVVVGAYAGSTIRVDMNRRLRAAFATP